MRILVLGGSGMLGHALLRHFQPRHEVRVTLGRVIPGPLFTAANSIPGVDVTSTDRLSLQAREIRAALEALVAGADEASAACAAAFEEQLSAPVFRRRFAELLGLDSGGRCWD